MVDINFIQSIGWLFLLMAIMNLFVVYNDKNFKYIIGIGFSVTSLIIFLISIVIFINMPKIVLNEEIHRMKTMMGLVKEETFTLPMKISGSYSVPSNAPNKGDALHSFDRRKVDGFGGYMLRGNPPSEWSQNIKYDQGKSINQALITLKTATKK